MYYLKSEQARTQKNGGFTLIEVLIAVVIFSTSLAGLLLMVGTGIGNVYVSRNRLVANYLAQEGIELMRYKRDYMVTSNPGSGWTSFQNLLNNTCSQSSPCGVSAIRPLDPPIDCGPNNPTNCDVMQDDTGINATGAYDMRGTPGTSNWFKTMFSRKLYLDANGSNDAYTIYSSVSWTEGTGSYTTTMSETIYNWQ